MGGTQDLKFIALVHATQAESSCQLLQSSRVSHQCHSVGFSCDETSPVETTIPFFVDTFLDPFQTVLCMMTQFLFFSFFMHFCQGFFNHTNQCTMTDLTL